MQSLLQLLYLGTGVRGGFIAWSSQQHLGIGSQKEKKMEKRLKNWTDNFLLLLSWVFLAPEESMTLPNKSKWRDLFLQAEGSHQE